MFLNSLNIAGSALTAEQYRLNLIAQNISNAENTRTENGGPYRRKTPVYQEVTDRYGSDPNNNTNSIYNRLSFSDILGRAASSRPNFAAGKAVYIKPNLNGYARNGVDYETSGNYVKNKYNFGNNNITGTGGVRISEVIEDPEPGKIIYDPGHPDADEDGYVEMPNVNMTQEMIDMMGAGRAYEANIQVVNAIKAMAARALEIGR